MKKTAAVQKFNSLESLLNYATVKYFGAEQHEIEQHANLLTSRTGRDFYDENPELLAGSLFYTVDGFVLKYFLLAGQIYCAYLIADPESHLTIGNYYLFGSYFNQLIGPFRTIVNHWFHQLDMVADMEEMLEI